MKRYDCYYTNDFGSDYSAFSKEAADGDWVSFEDHEAEVAQLRGTLSLAEEGLANYAQENGQLRSALKGLSDMYARTWDRVDGALVMMPDSIPRFEKAHSAAREALGELSGRSAEPQPDKHADQG